MYIILLHIAPMVNYLGIFNTLTTKGNACTTEMFTLLVLASEQMKQKLYVLCKDTCDQIFQDRPYGHTNKDTLFSTIMWLNS